jgi:hypothetical protein
LQPEILALDLVHAIKSGGEQRGALRRVDRIGKLGL